MKRGKLEKLDIFVSLSSQRPIQIMIVLGLLYLLLVTVEIPFVLKAGLSALSQEALSRPRRLNSEEDFEEKEAPTRPLESVSQNSPYPSQSRLKEPRILSTLVFDPRAYQLSRKDGASELYKFTQVAWDVGNKLWSEIKSGKVGIDPKKDENRLESCPLSLSLSGPEFVASGQAMELPCGLTLGSHITLVGKTRRAHHEYDPKISVVKDGNELPVMVSQFKLELQGLRTVEGEDPPRVLHFNPRLKGDWSGKPMIEMNTCYRMQWGSATRCEGWKSMADEETGESFMPSIITLLFYM